VEETNAPILRRIWIRFQGASMGAYLSYAPIDATWKTDSKTSKMGAFVSSTSLIIQASTEGRYSMADSVYKVIELVGTSPESWEFAARNAIEAAGQSLRDLRIAEVGKLDMKVENGKVTAYRARVKLSFKYGGD
jgi:dodecin